MLTSNFNWLLVQPIGSQKWGISFNSLTGNDCSTEQICRSSENDKANTWHRFVIVSHFCTSDCRTGYWKYPGCGNFPPFCAVVSRVSDGKSTCLGGGRWPATQPTVPTPFWTRRNPVLSDKGPPSWLCHVFLHVPTLAWGCKHVRLCKQTHKPVHVVFTARSLEACALCKKVWLYGNLSTIF